MIQRIQTVYLILVIALGMAMFFVPVYKVHNADTIVKDNDNSMYLDMNIQKKPGGMLSDVSVNNYILKSLDIIMVLCCGWGIGSYKTRRRQLLLSRIGLVFSVLFLCMIWYSIISLRSTMQIDPNQSQAILAGAWLPLLPPLLLFLAGKSILHDIRLVKSSDRLR